MRRSLGPLLCELHSHTRWSDGELSVAELVDLHGRNGFDVLCVTDHVVRREERRRNGTGSMVGEDSWDSYLDEVEREAERARETYGMLVIPGLELTFNDSDPMQAAHAVAIGLRSFVPVDDGIERAISSASTAGAAVIAAHPYAAESAEVHSRLTKRWACDEALRDHAHRFELFNRTQLYGWVAEAGLPSVASGDFHRREHLAGWKTLLPTHLEEAAVVDYLRSARPVYLARFEAAAGLAAA